MVVVVFDVPEENLLEDLIESVASSGLSRLNPLRLLLRSLLDCCDAIECRLCVVGDVDIFMAQRKRLEGKDCPLHNVTCCLLSVSHSIAIGHHLERHDAAVKST